jgi:hypothetical protein
MLNTREELPEFLFNRGCRVGVEIGVYRGEFTEQLCKAGLKVYGVDPWLAFKGQGGGQKIQANQEENYECAKKLLSPYDCELIRKTSMDALGDFPGVNLDFVYIDGDHNFRYVAEDIYEWTKKVRPGGIISGHDYFHTGPEAHNTLVHVDAVVDAYVKLFEIKDLQIFGKNIQNWMFTK